jgi:hypothetical protein
MNKSAVCRIANRISRDVSRHDAFIQAWAIVKAGGLELAVKGVSFGNRQEALRRLARYNPADVWAVLVPEPENPADPDAVAVMVGVRGGRGLYRLGYVPRTLTPIVRVMNSRVPRFRLVEGEHSRGARVTLEI